MRARKQRYRRTDSVDKPGRPAILRASNDGPHGPDRPDAQVAELVDALASGASGRKAVEVRVFSWAPFFRPDRL